MTSLSIGQLATAAGVTERALRLYERRGLLKPGRSPAGQRRYRVEDVTRLAQIRALTGMGCTLAQTVALLSVRTLDAAELVELKLEQLEAERDRVERRIETLRAAKQRITDQPIDAIGLAELLRDAAADLTAQQAVLDRWFSVAEQQSWRRAGADTGSDPRWQDLLVRVKQAIAAGVAPEEEAGRALATEWCRLLRPLMEGVVATDGEAAWSRGTAMYRDQTSYGEGGMRPEHRDIYDWVFNAAAAAGFAI